VPLFLKPPSDERASKEVGTRTDHPGAPEVPILSRFRRILNHGMFLSVMLTVVASCSTSPLADALISARVRAQFVPILIGSVAVQFTVVFLSALVWRLEWVCQQPSPSDANSR
jgi:hypothetical protein